MPANDPFRIALNMAGAVSAGAYTAGVLDFLVEALDAWYAERDNQARLHGADPSQWEIQSHDVMLEALTGASAGGMCAAISAIALMEEFDHVKNSNAGDKVNRLYKSWVQTIDILPLLGTKDLDNGDGAVHSLLDCTPIDEIAAMALTADPARRKDRPWVSKQLSLVLTISNLRGIPYMVDKTGNNFEERIGYHADQVEFAVNEGGQSTGTTAIALVYPNQPPENWRALQIAAMATGAFPVALRARIVNKTRAYYENKQWRVSTADPGSTGQCYTTATIEPAWDNPPASFDIVCSDGGITNNNPFDCAHDILIHRAGDPGHAPRTAVAANAAVISVAPFPGDERFDPNYNAQAESSLIEVLKSLVPMLVSQSRFQGENLLLTGDPDVHSRFAIAPSDDTNPGVPALCCGVLDAFGGFIDRKFRDRDYHLGRRNCQQFLRVHFSLPESNPLIAAGLPQAEAAREKLKVPPPPGVTKRLDERWFRIIPLVPSTEEEIVIPTRDNARTNEDRVEAVAEQAAERTKRVLTALVSTPEQHHPFLIALINTVLALGGSGKLKSYFRDTIADQLKASNQL